jgi:hypothetical protein
LAGTTSCEQYLLLESKTLALRRGNIKKSLVAFGVVILILVTGIALLLSLKEKRPIGVDELRSMPKDGAELEGKTVLVGGDTIFDPYSDFGFNALYLVDTQTPSERRYPGYAFWFGIGIDDVSCETDGNTATWVCQPLDPSQATAFEFKGTVHLDFVGKRPVMSLSDIDFEHRANW